MKLTGIFLLFLIFKSFPTIKGDWLAFSGSIIGVIGAYLVAMKQIKKQSKQYENDKFDNTFFHLLGIFKETKEKKDVQVRLILFLEEIETRAKGRKEDEIDKCLENYIEQTHLKKLKDYVCEIITNYFDRDTIKVFVYDDLIREAIDSNMKSKCWKKLDNWIKTYYKFYEEYEYNCFIDINQLIYQPSEENLRKVNKDFFDSYSDFYNEERLQIMKDVDTQKHLLTLQYEYKERYAKDLINELGDKYHKYLGTYFRTFYVVVDFVINNNTLNIDEKKKYLRILRSLLSSQELIAIFYNANYYHRGVKTRELLTKENMHFFASEEDVAKVEEYLSKNKKNSTIPESEKLELTYFNYQHLYFNELDFSKLK